MKKIKCEVDGCRSKMIKPKDSKVDSFMCYRHRRKIARKPKQEAYAKAHAPVETPAEVQPAG